MSYSGLKVFFEGYYRLDFRKNESGGFFRRNHQLFLQTRLDRWAASYIWRYIVGLNLEKDRRREYKDRHDE